MADDPFYDDLHREQFDCGGIVVWGVVGLALALFAVELWRRFA